MNQYRRLANERLDDLRLSVVEHFAILLEGQQKNRSFAGYVAGMSRDLHGDLALALQDFATTRLDAEQQADLAGILGRFAALRQAMGLLTGERQRQWQNSSDHFRRLLFEFNRNAEALAETLVQKEILERQGRVLNDVILAYEKIGQWQEFLAEVVGHFAGVFPTHALSFLFLREGRYTLHCFTAPDAEILARVRAECLARLTADPDAPWSPPVQERDVEVAEYPLPTPVPLLPISRTLVVSVPGNLTALAGLQEVVLHGPGFSCAEEEEIVYSLLTVLLCVVGASKVLSDTMAELAYRSMHDPLTGLYNRRYFNEIMEYEVGRSERHGHEFSILMLDLDDFKDVNDSHGHAVGDQVLVRLAEMVRANLRKGDIATRLGGDEFAVILTETPREGGRQVGETLRQVLRDLEFEASGLRFRITTSIGLIAYPQDARTVTDLMAGVDMALYRAKGQGKDAVCMLDGAEEQVREQRDTRAYAERLRYALSEGRILPHYQPIVSCQSGQVMGYEALARLREPSGEMVTAAGFMGAIMRYGLGRDLDRVILSSAMQAKKAVEEGGGDPGIRLFLNLSAQEILGRDILRFASDYCRELGLSPRSVVFEILEQDAIGDMVNMGRFLTDLRAEGFAFAIDDFGSGYSTFHYLRDLRFEYVKIAGDFVRHLGRDGVDHLLVKNLALLCRDLGIATIGEWVESTEVLARLRELGVDYAQGYALGRPADHMPIVAPGPLETPGPPPDPPAMAGADG